MATMKPYQMVDVQKKESSDVREIDCENRPYQEVDKRMKYIVCLVMFSVAVAIPTVMLTQKPVKPDPAENEVPTYDFPYVSRSEWGARKPVETLPLRTPVPYVVIHHSYEPAACYNRQECVKAMQSMQKFHIDERHWWDIGYHFAVGSDAVAYEGRGWSILGAHSLHFNNVSVGICVIGDWTNAVPPAEQLKTVKSLIAAGVELGYIEPDYKLLGHRQVRDTECPGQAFYNVIKTWDHWVTFPVPGMPELGEDFMKEYSKKIKGNV